MLDDTERSWEGGVLARTEVVSLFEPLEATLDYTFRFSLPTTQNVSMVAKCPEEEPIRHDSAI